MSKPTILLVEDNPDDVELTVIRREMLEYESRQTLLTAERELRRSQDRFKSLTCEIPDK
jgi:hypothetical protein